MKRLNKLKWVVLVIGILLVGCTTSPPIWAAATATITPNPKFTAMDANGDPYVGGKLYTYETGTTTPKTSWTDSTKGTPNTNPVILDSRGQADVWIDSSDGAYRLKFTDSDDVEIWTRDSIEDLQGYEPIFHRQALIGGGVGALDGIDGDSLANNDIAMVTYSENMYIYRLHSTSGAAESSPDIITPDTNPGTKRWILQGAYFQDITATGSITTLSNLAVTSGNVSVWGNIDATGYIAAGGLVMANSHGVLEGDVSGGRVLRASGIFLVDGTNANTVKVSLEGGGTYYFNGNNKTEIDNIGSDYSGTYFSLDLESNTLVAKNAIFSGIVVGVLASSIQSNGATIPINTTVVRTADGIQVEFHNYSGVAQSIPTLMDNGNISILVSYITSE